MKMSRNLYVNVTIRLLIVAALSIVLAVGTAAQGRDDRSSGRSDNGNMSSNQKIGSGYRQDNRRDASPGRSGGGYASPERGSARPENNQHGRDYRDQPSAGMNNNNRPPRVLAPRQGRQDNTGIGTHDPVIPNPDRPVFRQRNDRKSPNDPVARPDPGNEASKKGDRGLRNDKGDRYYSPNIYNPRPDNRQYNPGDRNDRQYSRQRDSHNFRDRDYRDSAPVFRQDRDHGNWDRGHMPNFRDGHYYYPDRPHYRPSLFGFWGFNYDPGFCRSIYFYYGYYPYIASVRVFIGPYVEIGYYSTPVVISHNDYYLAARRTNQLDYALSDIRKAWTDGRSDLIANYVDDDQTIAVLLDGKYNYSVEPKDYLQMTSDAIDETQTVSFTWQSVRERTNGDYTAFGKHTYVNADGNTQTVYVSYTLRMIDGNYVIIEVGSAKHTLI